MKSSSHSSKASTGVLVFFRKDLLMAELSRSRRGGVEGDLPSSKLVAIMSRTLTLISDFDLVSILLGCLPLANLLERLGLWGSKVESSRLGLVPLVRALLLLHLDKNLCVKITCLRVTCMYRYATLFVHVHVPVFMYNILLCVFLWKACMLFGNKGIGYAR